MNESLTISGAGYGARLFRREINGGRVSSDGCLRLWLPAVSQGYADAQVDDYGTAASGRRKFPWQPGVKLSLRARFSHSQAELVGTAGFGWWNVPFADPAVRWPALPQATWFFFGSEPTDLPLARHGPGRGWFAATIDAGNKSALTLLPVAPVVLLLNQFSGTRRRVWPGVQRRLGIAYRQLEADMAEWHHYSLIWKASGCSFAVDGETVLQTAASPRGTLAFVCWIDNQYMVVTARGHFGSGTLATTEAQWLEASALELSSFDSDSAA